MKMMLATTPIRPMPTPFPPIGSLSIIKYLKKNGVDDIEFYNIDANRPSYEEALAHIKEQKPDVLGVSAVVSTAYAYTKQLTLDVKEALPETLVVVGGSLAASAEILLRRTGTDLCVTGEGEITFLNIVRRAANTRKPSDYSDIPGIVMFDRNDRLINTGYEEQLPPDEVYDFDWEDLERSADIDIFVAPVFNGDVPNPMFREDPRTFEPERRNKTHIVIPTAKGCVAKCTFCHRFTRGIRYIPIPIVMERIREVIERYDVGFLEIGDENFGTDRRWLKEFCENIRKFDILWRVSGMRVNCVNPETITMMRDAGCAGIQFGMETGSEKMIEIMEKKVKIEDNYNAVRWTVEAGLRTVVQLVIGMPGETPETIRETAQFAKYANSLSASQCPTELSINYAQALPGTPLYEFGRAKGLIGQDLDGEEEYLLRISDKNAHDEENTLNFTAYPKLLCETWRLLIQIETNREYIRKYGIDHYRNVLLRYSQHFKRPEDSGYFANPKRLVDRSETTDTIHDVNEATALKDKDKFPSFWSLVRERKIGLATVCYPILFYRLRHFLLLLMILRNYRYRGRSKAWRLFKEYISWRLDQGLKRDLIAGARSLRKVINDWGTAEKGEAAMGPLRRGR